MPNSIEYVESGEDYFNRLDRLIEHSKEELHFQTYIFEPDETGEKVATALKKAARRGVKIYLLLDSFGSSNLYPSYVQDLVQAGIKVHFFAPLFSAKGLYLGRRLHHKVVTADKKIALIGGINVADKYRGTSEEKAWLDFAAEIKGSACNTAVKICRRLWGKKVSFRKFWSKRPAKKIKPDKEVKIVHNDWLRRISQVDKHYIYAVRHKAQESITLVASYFLPGMSFRRALVNAVKKGVSVKLILAGPTDVPLMKYSASHLYKYLLKNGIEIYEWTESVLHGKAMMVDQKWCTLGSYNLNYLSRFGSIETNVETTDKAFLETFSARLERFLEGSEQITPEKLQNSYSWWIRLRNWAAYRLMRRVFFIMNFFSYHRFTLGGIKE